MGGLVLFRWVLLYSIPKNEWEGIRAGMKAGRRRSGSQFISLSPAWSMGICMGGWVGGRLID